MAREADPVPDLSSAAMISTAEGILSKAMALPTEPRAFVAERLIESLDAPDALPLSEQWRQELRRRCAEIDQGAAEIREASEVFARAYKSRP